jgi:endonuclease/exonuclease/phosphatase family metal-dependent hydrolase
MLLISYNIQYGFGADGVYDLARSAEVLRDADIIALQEVERGWSRSRGDDQPLLLEHFLPGYFTVYGPTMDLDGSRRDGERVINRRRQFGQMILSRWPILWSRLHLLPMRRMIDPLNTQTGLLETCIASPSGPLRVMSVHLAHVGVEERLEQIAHLRAILDRATHAGPPWSGRDDEPVRNWTEGGGEPPNPASLILMGDFNCEPGSAEMDALLGNNPWHPGALYHGGLVDAVARTGVRLHSHVKVIDGQTRLRQLDHVLVSPDLVPGLRAAWTDYSVAASDHYPVWVEVLQPGETPRCPMSDPKPGGMPRPQRPLTRREARRNKEDAS